MMKELIWLSGVFLVTLGHSATKPMINVEQFGNVVRFFNTATLCEHKSVAKTRFDDEGRLYISFKTNIKPSESDDDLCKCMWQYINQQCWLTDAERKCVVEGTQITMYLIGPTNPNYNPLKPLPIMDKPVATLAEVVQYYPAAEFGGHICSSTSMVNDDGQTSLLVQCKLTEQSPKLEKVCENIFDYLNQCEWLGATKTNCSRKDGKVLLEIIGK